MLYRPDAAILPVLLLLTVVIWQGFFTNFIPMGSQNTGTLLIDLACLGVYIAALRQYSLRHIRLTHTHRSILVMLLILAIFTILKGLADDNAAIERVMGWRNWVFYLGICAALPLLSLSLPQIQLIGKWTAWLSVGLLGFSILQFWLAPQLPLSYLVLRGEEAFSFQGTNIVRATGLVGNTVIYSGFTIIVSALALSSALVYGHTPYWVCLCLGFAANLCTVSRASFFGFFLMLWLGYALHFRVWHSPQIRSILLSGLLLVLGLWIFLWVFRDTFFVQRMLGVEITTQGSTRVHWLEVQKALHYLYEHPLTGAGLGSQGISAKGARLIITDGHWFQLLLEMGIPLGLLWLGGFLGTFIYALIHYLRIRHLDTPLARQSRVLYISFLLICVYFGVAGLLNSSFVGRVNYLLYALLLGSILQIEYHWRNPEAA